MNQFTSFKQSVLIGVVLMFSVMVNAQAADKVTLTQSFKQADIKTVIEAVSKLTGHNFIIDPRVKGKVTLIAPAPMDADDLYETLLSILRVHGYVAVPGKTAIQIIPANLARDHVPFHKEGAEDSGWVTEVVDVINVPASKLVAVMRPLVARDGHLVALSESNKLIITDSVNNIGRIKSILKRVDVNESTGFEVVQLKHASAQEMVRTLKASMPKSSGLPLTISSDERTNQLIITGDPIKRLETVQLIKQLDTQVSTQGQVQVIYLHYAKAKDLVPILKKIATNPTLINSGGDSNAPANNQKAKTNISTLNDKTLKSSISIEAEERMNAIVISAPSSVTQSLKQVIKQLDVRRAQVLIEAILVEVSESKTARLGVEWGIAGPDGVGAAAVEFGNGLTGLVSGSPVAQLAAIAGGGSLLVGNTLDNGAKWGALVRALDTDTASNILATPSLLTLDNEEAQIVVGREVPFTTGSYSSTGTTSTNPFQTIERKNVGLSLKIKPQINEGDEVFLEIDQEVSDVLPKGDAVDIQTSKRQIKTKVIVGDGQIIVLGGLLTEREVEVEKKIPGLGDIPWIGGLFTSTSTEREKVNLMIFIRPTIIRDNSMSNYYSRQKYTRIRDLQTSQLEKHSGMLTGLRPRLPTIEQWQKGQYSTPLKPERKETEKLKSMEDNNTDASSDDDYIDELF